MLRIFTTQLTGSTRALLEKQEEEIEDAARLLAQALTSDGTVYIAAFGEMKSIEAEALYGKDAFPQMATFHELDSLTEQDRVIITTRHSGDPDAVQLATQLSKQHVPILSITTVTDDEGDSLVNLSDVLININAHNGLVPTDDGSRIGYPASILGLHAYFCLYLTVKDILMEMDE
ncbi:DUF2529 family protein [Alkalicoccobacillus murimartini]|uniref:Phosphoheptose isomerase n=1 Tax=Alkalicoccobacillus murimartini TaxID=171685 RepID=A0ABT9YGT7_9BACI|nr:DUF2529 family protein [Alkalicoccobacillus murimartini]MDQ0207070.1 phosphoheptose isomerase [Alkalicoccobacillus murimartini]